MIVMMTMTVGLLYYICSHFVVPHVGLRISSHSMYSDNLASLVIISCRCYPFLAIIILFCPNMTTLRSGLCYRKSVCRLSVVCNVGAPYSAG